MIKTKQLTRMCASCGMEKPLSAFLQMGPQGTSYGEICITCRNRPPKKNTASEEIQEEGDTTLPPKNRIGSKEKLFISKEQNRQFKDIKELLKQEIKKKEELSQVKIEKKDTENKAYKKRHDIYLEKKINEEEQPQKKSDIENAQLKDKPVMSFLQPQKVIEEQALAEQKIKEKMIEKEIREAATDFNQLNHVIQAGKLEYQSASFLRFQALIGRPLLGTAEKGLESAKKVPPIVKVMQKFYAEHTSSSDPKQEKKGTEITQSILNRGLKGKGR